ncbi:hypothetical protein ASG11_00235 [Sphingomonas sp. Leaf357]|uniref:hypothetical protein n=1 Tax=Sphingomonas sp. Leaf357 TaxID=1736350 RepID=UPI0006F247AA|nr:hypothetical protein [Sphingomonas sp. Leaf357]KQS02894.1 hypothetical protein ASG11_00235 [Sphingomonas sp. Leaf357]
MSAFTGRAIGLGFAVLWLLVGAAALPAPWYYSIAAAGLAAIAVLAWRAWRMHEPRTGLFRMNRYWVAVVAEFAAIAFAQIVLIRLGLTGYLLPVVGILVGVHFVGLWWAGGGERYLRLAGVMTALDAAALLLPPGGRAMQAVAGLGSAAALAWFAGTGART